jgi:hypothetical protein
VRKLQDQIKTLTEAAECESVQWTAQLKLACEIAALTENKHLTEDTSHLEELRAVMNRKQPSR